MRVLIIQLAKLGDILQTQRLVENLLINSCTVDLLCSELFLEAVELLNPAVRAVCVNLDEFLVQKDTCFYLIENTYFHKMVQGLNKNNYDLIINLNSGNYGRDLLRQLKGEKIGFYAGDLRSESWLKYAFSTIKSRLLHTINLVDIFAGLSPFPLTDKPLFPWRESEYTVIHPGSRNLKRQWPLEYYHELAILLHERGEKIILSGTETASLERLEKGLPFKVENLAGRTKLKDLAEILKNGQFLSADTGPMHLAALQNSKVTSVFLGCAYPYETLGYGSRVKVVFPEIARVPCYPCQDDNKCHFQFYCHGIITPAMVLSAWENKKADYIYKTSYDLLGQYLIPTEKAMPDYRQLAGILFRMFALKEFLHQEAKIEDYTAFYLPDEEYQKACKRELILYEHTRKLVDSTPKLELLQPLCLLKKLPPTDHLEEKCLLFLKGLVNTM